MSLWDSLLSRFSEVEWTDGPCSCDLVSGRPRSRRAKTTAMVPPLPRWSGPGTEGRWLRDGQQLGTGNCLSRFPPPNRSQRASKHAKISPNYVEKTPEIGRFATLWPLPNRTFCIRMYPCNPSFSLHRPLLRRLSHPSRTICRISAALQP